MKLVLLRRIDDQDIYEMADVAEAMANRKPGDEVLFTLYRDGEAHMIIVTLGNMPAHLRD